VRGTVLYGPRDVRFEERPEPTIVEPTDALIRLPLTSVCGSDLWPYRGIEPITEARPMGHEYVGIVEEVGSAVEKFDLHQVGGGGGLRDLEDAHAQVLGSPS
jgi:threonine dehydrogenase-like Zn-dependent dehydrogenase